MWDRITIERVASDDLSRQGWSFVIIENMVVLDFYTLQQRPSKRHKFRIIKSYDRLATRRLSEEMVPAPQDVFVEALSKARAQMAVGLWHRDFKR